MMIFIAPTERRFSTPSANVRFPPVPAIIDPLRTLAAAVCWRLNQLAGQSLNIFRRIKCAYLLALSRRRLDGRLRLIERIEESAPFDLILATYKASTQVALMMPSEAAVVLRQSEGKRPRVSEDEAYVRSYRAYLWAIIHGQPDIELRYADARSVPASRLTRRLLS